jgi:hypothetical protein
MTGARDMVERQSLVGSRYLVVAEPTGLDVFIGERVCCGCASERWVRRLTVPCRHWELTQSAT